MRPEDLRWEATTDPNIRYPQVLEASGWESFIWWLVQPEEPRAHARPATLGVETTCSKEAPWVEIVIQFAVAPEACEGWRSRSSELARVRLARFEGAAAEERVGLVPRAR